MPENPITNPLPADLPENWLNTQTIAAAGADVGLSAQHGYNYLMSQVNAAQRGVNTLGIAFAGLTPAALGAVPISRKINGLPLSGDINLTPQNVGAVPTSRTVNGLPLSGDISLTPQNIGAVPTSRTVNGLPLSSDITLTPEDIGVTAKRTCTFVVGTSTAGWTAADCDYLCDGVDDQMEIQQAIDNLGNDGGKIMILQGLYHFSDPVKIAGTPSNYMNIEGMGEGTKIYHDYNEDNDNKGAFYIKSQLAGTNRIVISDISFSSGYIGSHYGIYNTMQSNMNYVSVQNCIFTGFNTCIYRASAYNCTFYSSLAYCCGISDGAEIIGCFFENKGSNRMIGVNGANIVSSCLFNNVTLGVQNATDIIGNRIICKTYTSSDTAIYGIHTSTGNSHLIIGNFIENGSNGIQCTDQMHYGRGSNISGNIIKNANYGLRIDYAENFTILGNTIFRGTGTSADYSSAQYTIYLSGTSNNRNLIACNNIPGKNYISDGGTGNTFVNNKYN